MNITYLSLLRGLVMPVEFSAQNLKKSDKDSIFLLETKQMSGYTTRETIASMLRREITSGANEEPLKLLMKELEQIRMDESQMTASGKVVDGISLLNWLGIEA